MLKPVRQTSKNKLLSSPFTDRINNSKIMNLSGELFCLRADNSAPHARTLPSDHPSRSEGISLKAQKV